MAGQEAIASSWTTEGFRLDMWKRFILRKSNEVLKLLREVVESPCLDHPGMWS